MRYNLMNTCANFCEALILSIRTIDAHEDIVLGFFYRSPTSSDENNTTLLQTINSLPCRKQPVIIMGDFNFPKINWDTCTTSTEIGSKEYLFIETLRDNFLQQLVKDPTRFRGADRPSVIDLIITNSESAVANLGLEAPLGRSDHRLLTMEVICPMTKEASEKKILNFNKGNYEELRQRLDRAWEDELRNKPTVEDKWNHFIQHYESAVNSTIPARKRFTKFKVALDPKIRKKIKEKKKLYKEALNQRTEAASLKYRRVSNQVRNLTRKAEKERERRVADEVKDNPKKFWNMVR
jgi:hypothetical protein